MNSKILAVVAVLVLVVAGVAVWQMGATNDSEPDDEEGKTVEVTDNLGLKVSVKLPVKTVAFGACTSLDIFAHVMGDGWEDYVSMMPEDMKSREPSKLNHILETYPELKDKPLVPDFMRGFPAQTVVAESPDLFIVPAAYIDAMGGVDVLGPEIKKMTEAGVPVLCIDFYNNSFTPDIAADTYGILGKIMQKEDRAQKIIDFYNDKVNDLQKKIEPVKKSFTYLTEVHMNPDLSIVGNVPFMGSPEMIFLGGENVNKDPSMAMPGAWTMEDTIAADPDYYCFATTCYGGGHGILGPYLNPTDQEVLDEFAPLNDRAGWSDLKSIKNHHLAFVYGELRNSVFGLQDLYQMANFIYPDTVSQADVQKITDALDQICPFGFDGRFIFGA